MSDSFHDPQQNLHHTLQRLQQHTRSNIPAMMAQRAMTTFSLQAEPKPDEAHSTVVLVVYPQNPFMGEPEIRRMSAKDIQSGLTNSRFQIRDSHGVLALPDSEGNYLFWPDSPEFDQVNAFYYATFTLRMFERFANRVIPWSFVKPRLLIDPHVGDLANAFYNEQEQLLGFHTFKTRSGHSQSTAQSADIVAHETAHAVLDGLRDLFNESFGLGTRAFHESFGDIAAILVALHDDGLIRRVLELTDNDLRKTNFITEVAENLVNEVVDTEHLDEHSLYLRNAFNEFKDIPFDELVYNPEFPANQLSRQEHNYSRLFTGAFYDLLVGIYEALRMDQMPPFVALYRARDIIGHVLITAIELGPIGELSFADMARAFLTAESVLFGGRYQEILKTTFDHRLILLRADSEKHLDDLRQLPDLRLPPTINQALSATLFLENEILPTLKLSPAQPLLPMATYRNAAGYAFMVFFSTSSLILEGADYQDYQGVQVDVFGGLTLMFDVQNRLKSAVYRPVLDEDIRQIKVIIKDMIVHNQIVTNIYPPTTELEPNPDALFIEASDQTLYRRLVKYPVFFDEIPDNQ